MHTLLPPAIEGRISPHQCGQIRQALVSTKQLAYASTRKAGLKRRAKDANNIGLYI